MKKMNADATAAAAAVADGDDDDDDDDNDDDGKGRLATHEGVGMSVIVGRFRSAIFAIARSAARRSIPGATSRDCVVGQRRDMLAASGVDEGRVVEEWEMERSGGTRSETQGTANPTGSEDDEEERKEDDEEEVNEVEEDEGVENVVNADTESCKDVSSDELPREAGGEI